MQKKPMPPRFLVKEITSPPAAARQNFGSVRQKQQQAVSSNYINAPNNNYINNNNNSSSNNYNGKNGTASNYVEEYYIDNTNNQKQSTKLLATSNISDNRNGPSYVKNENTTQNYTKQYQSATRSVDIITIIQQQIVTTIIRGIRSFG